MSKTCTKHQCFKKEECEHKIWLGYLPLCGLNNLNCPHCAPLPYGRYEPEDVLLPWLIFPGSVE